MFRSRIIIYSPKSYFPLLLCLAACLPSCAPFYTWGYAPAVHPDAASAYVRAVMARESGDCLTALSLYNKALHLTWSDAVKNERDQLKNCVQ